LIANFAPPRPQEQSSQLYLKGKKRQLIPGIAAISPGMVIELSGPPGGGKTCISIASAISARLGDGGEEDGDREHPEVLMIGGPRV
jgi:RAD51-like protein 2